MTSERSKIHQLKIIRSDVGGVKIENQDRVVVIPFPNSEVPFVPNKGITIIDRGGVRTK